MNSKKSGYSSNRSSRGGALSRRSSNVPALKRANPVVNSLRRKIAEAVKVSDTTVKELRKLVLSGAFMCSSDPNPWKSPSFKLLVFISSASTDTNVERDKLLNSILPDLKIQGREFDVEISFVDMRWNAIPGDITVDERTWHDRMMELERCRQESSGLFFLSLQSDKYGLTPLPRCIRKDVFDANLPHCSSQEKEIAQTWYVLDTNAVPEQYVLKASTEDAVNWNGQFDLLCRALDGIKFDEECCHDLKIGASVPEWEIRIALEREQNMSRIFWLHRQFLDSEFNGILQKDDEYSDFGDMHKLQNLKNLVDFMSEHISADRIHRFPNVSFASCKEGDDTWEHHIDIWTKDALAVLNSSLFSVISMKAAWELNGCGLGVGGTALQEMLFHSLHAFHLCQQFVCRENALEVALNIIHADSDTEDIPKEFIHAVLEEHCAFDAIALAVVGKEGSGKSSMMAKLADTIYKTQCNPNRPVIIRFCGLGQGSCTGFDLIQSICSQIHLLQGEVVDISTFSESFESLIEHFHTLLHDIPMVLLIDGLDRLQDDNFCRSQLSFLKNIELHEESKIVVSTRSDEQDFFSNEWIQFFGCDVRLAEGNVPRIVLNSFHVGEIKQQLEVVNFELEGANPYPTEDAVEFFNAVLLSHGRTVTESQLSGMLSEVDASEGLTALHLAVLARVASEWTSYSPGIMPRGGLHCIIIHTLASLEMKYGKVVMKAVYGYITFAVQGVMEDEMKDLLSIDDFTLAASRETTRRDDFRFCTHIWIRIRNDLADWVELSDIHGFRWNHRHICDVVASLYSTEDKRDIHRALANYYGNRINHDRAERADIKIHSLLLNESAPGVTVWYRSAHINHRRCVEAAHHLIRGEMFEDAVIELCNIEGICARAKSGQGLSCLRELTDLSLQADRLCENSRIKVDHYLRWLSEDMVTIIQNPSLYVVQTCTRQPVISHARKDLEERMVGFRTHSEFTDDAWIRGITLTGKQDFGSLTGVLEGHTNRVSAVAWSPDNHTFLTGSWDRTIRKWNPVTGTLRSTCEGHSAAITALSWSPDSHKYASASWDNTVGIWDAGSGSMIQLLEGHTDFVCCVAWSPDNTRVVSGSYDNTVRLWGVTGEHDLGVIGTHDNWVIAVCWNPNSLFVASAGYDKKIKVWLIEDGLQSATMKGHVATINSISWSPNGQRIISGSMDKTVRVWDPSTGDQLNVIACGSFNVNSLVFNSNSTLIACACSDNSARILDASNWKFVNVLEGHKDIINAICWSPDNQRVGTGSADNFVRIWDARKTVSSKVVHECHVSAVSSTSWSPCGKYLVSGAQDHSIYVWDVAKAEVIRSLEGHSDLVNVVSWSPDGKRIFSGGHDSSSIVWDAETGALINGMTSHHGGVNDIAWNIKSDLVALALDNHTICVLDVASCEMMNELTGHMSAVLTVAWCPTTSSRLVSGSADNTVRIWYALTAKQPMILESHTNWITSVKWSPNGTFVASASYDMTIKVWDASSGKLWKNLLGHTNAVKSISWNADSRRLVSGSDDLSIITWDAVTGVMCCRLLGHRGPVTSVAYNPVSNQIASASIDKTVRVWDAVTGIYTSPK